MQAAPTRYSGAAARNLNFHVTNRAANPWRLGDSPFDEAVDISTVFTLINAAILIVTGVSLVSLRRSRGHAGHELAGDQDETDSGL